MICCGENRPPAPTIAAGRTASAIESTPHSPQPVGPAMCRRRSLQPRRPGARRATSAARCRRRAATISKLLDLAGACDHAFGEAEADREVLEIARRRHHHRIGAAVVADRDRRLLGDGARAVAACRPLRQTVLATVWTGSAASSTPRLRPACDPARAAAPARHSPSATPTGRSTATPAPRSPCIPGSWSPSRNSRW